MSGSAKYVKQVVDDTCGDLLLAMQNNFRGDAVGVSLALYYPGNTAVPPFFGYGLSAPNQGVTENTVYAIGSVTKVFTATLAAYLVQQGTIGNLGTTTVAPYLGNPMCDPWGVAGDYWSEVTFADFATQTSGMPDEAPQHISSALFLDEPPSCDLLAWWNNPGNQADWQKSQGDWIYSSAGFVTLGFAVTGAAGQGYTRLLRVCITEPLAMDRTFAADQVPHDTVLAVGYAGPGKQVNVTAASDLKSNASDMVGWMQAVHAAMSAPQSAPLPAAIVETTNVWIAQPKKPDGSNEAFAMGLGWQIPSQDSIPFLEKNGATSLGGCSCWIGLTKPGPGVPVVGVMVMTNQSGVGAHGISPDRYGRQILNALLTSG